MNRKQIYTAIVALMVAIAAQGTRVAYTMDEYKRWAKLSTNELMRSGQHFLQDKGLVDSALVCYAVVSRREGKAKDRDEQKKIVKAYNNLGFIYAAYYYD